MSKSVSIIVAVCVGLALGVGGLWFALDAGYISVGSDPAIETEALATGSAVVKRHEAAEGKKILYWTAPMDPNYISETPGKSPMGMDLIPVYEDSTVSVAPGTVIIDPVTVQNIGVRTATVERRPLERVIRTVGRVEYDEKRVAYVHSKVEGWIEKLYVNYTGAEVKADDMLLAIYSPALVSAQEEYLLSRRYSESIQGVGRQSISELSRRRLELWDVPAHQIRELEKTGKVMKTLHIHSPATGVVVEKHAVEGMFIKPGMKLYTIADMSKVWVYADVYENEIPWVSIGSEVEMTLASQPGRVFKGTVAFIYPFMEGKSRTNKVRLEFDNPALAIKPDMYANVTLRSGSGRIGIGVPKEAVLLSGERSLVMLKRAAGKFTPVEVVLGVESDDYYEVTAGIEAGDVVVTSAHFLIDAESRLKEAVSKMLEVRSGSGESTENKEGNESEKKHKPMQPDKEKSKTMDSMKMDSMKMDHNSMQH
ncbi:MAG: efflux RND transporter periplasmic adaptor subunit [Proteobacteria bacterium]|nr:efflux RND transporter periplasmic adaptor subunit [Pseudomonadota bacterium]